MDQYMVAVTSMVASKLSVEYLLLIAVYALWVVVYYVSCHLYFAKLKTKIWLTQGMMNMLPFTIVINNDLLYNAVTRWTVQ